MSAIKSILGMALVVILFTSCGLFRGKKREVKQTLTEQVVKSDSIQVNTTVKTSDVKQTDTQKVSSTVTNEEIVTIKKPGGKSTIEIPATDVKKNPVTVLDSFGNVFTVKMDSISQKLSISLNARDNEQTTIRRIINQNDSTGSASTRRQQAVAATDIRGGSDSKSETSKTTDEKSEPKDVGWFTMFVWLVGILGAVFIIYIIFKKRT